MAKFLSPQKLHKKTELVIKDVMLLPLKRSRPMKAKYLLQEKKEKSTNEQKMEELTSHGVVKAPTRINKTSIKKKMPSLKRIKELQDAIICEYEDTDSLAFGKTATSVCHIITKKFPLLKDHITDKLIRTTLEQNSSTYSKTRKVKKNKFFHGTSFYSTQPHYQWHVHPQDMVIFKKALLPIDKKKMAYNFMLICVDKFSNYIMVELLKDKCASTVHMAMVPLIQRPVLRNRPSADARTHFIKLDFINKGIDTVNLPSILRSKSVTERVPTYFKEKEPPIISYTLYKDYCQ